MKITCNEIVYTTDEVTEEYKIDCLKGKLYTSEYQLFFSMKPEKNNWIE
jgi:hypothetical protein